MSSTETGPRDQQPRQAPPDGDPARPGSDRVQEPKKKMTFKLVAFVVVGALGGLAYYKFVGCRSGVCPITSNPYISTAYGAVIGYLASGGWS